MPESLIAGGEVWLHPDERVVEMMELVASTHLGLITTRHNGVVYASLLRLGIRRGYYFDVPQWEFTALECAIVGSIEEARVIVQAAASLQDDP